jgi:membrane fusion protein (multidrug efflux system)
LQKAAVTRPTLPRAFALMMLLPIALAGCKAKDERTPPAPEAGFVVLKNESVPLFVELAGRTAAFETSDVRPQVTGVIRARQFEEGAMVTQGQTLYQIDSSLYAASAAQARATLANAQAAQVSAQALADRYRPLAAMEAVSKQDYTNALASARQAAANVQQARAQLETANVNLRFTRVPAPITGRIGRSLFTTGALVTAGQTDALTTIQRLDPMFVDIPESSGDLLALRRSLSSGGITPSSAQVTLQLEDGSTYELPGQLQFTESMVDPATGTVTLRARFPNPSGLLLPGMYVRARLSQATVTQGILVPQAGVSRDPQGNATVMLVGAGNKAESRTVTADRTVGASWLVTNGLKPGDKVIVEGLGKIKPGKPIKPVPAGSKPKKPKGAGVAAGGAG